MHADLFRLAPAGLVQLLELNDLTHSSGQDRVARKIVKALEKKTQWSSRQSTDGCC